MTDQNPIFIPGPTNIPDRIRNAMNRQTVDHRSPKFSELFGSVLQDLKTIFKTSKGTVFAFPSTGTGGWEAAIENTLAPGDKVLAARHGVFSHRWIDMCQRHGLDVEVIESEWGNPAPAETFAERLAADKAGAIKAVLVTHNETATGVRSDIAAVRQALDRAGHGALLLADGVSSIASMNFEMDAWGVDVAVSGSQKGFMLPAGLALVAASEKALELSRVSKTARCFFDFQEMLKANKAGGYPYTPALQHFYGLRESLDMLSEEGLDRVFARHRRAADAVRAAVSGWGLELCSKSAPHHSDTISAVYVPAGFDSNVLTDLVLKKYNVSFGIGLGQMNGKAFRIGHLGSITDTMILGGLATIEMAMNELGYPVALGSGTTAAQQLFAQRS
ncbi:serine--glyoxylate aminotransferase [Rhizobium sp. R635]|uniref:pyridoxal-phosphate-dependent aminotransferase family protein n=1 Tax=Rhizobium sp. R635 TaxID=1764275 RepID=UPI000B52BAB9|nr:aminotransferase class V-fold PLP-dependent enzyme [Rhizobium sp. R635]OWV87632.1 serine--glyoxylate aminotransferase [Rhizobium sp. R635]